jgi:hypothetical protein
MKWPKLFLVFLLVFTFITSIVFVGISQPNTQPVSLYIVIPQKLASLLNVSSQPFSMQSVVPYASIATMQGQVYTLQQSGIKTYAQLINFSLHSINASFSNDCLLYKQYQLCSNATYSWQVVIVNSNGENAYSFQQIANTPINTIFSPTTAVFIYFDNRGVLYP